MYMYSPRSLRSPASPSGHVYSPMSDDEKSGERNCELPERSVVQTGGAPEQLLRYSSKRALCSVAFQSSRKCVVTNAETEMSMPSVSVRPALSMMETPG